MAGGALRLLVPAWGPVNSKDRVWGGNRMGQSSAVFSGACNLESDTFVGSGLLKGGSPKGPLTALDSWEPQLQESRA